MIKPVLNIAAITGGVMTLNAKAYVLEEGEECAFDNIRITFKNSNAVIAEIKNQDFVKLGNEDFFIHNGSIYTVNIFEGNNGRILAMVSEENEAEINAFDAL